MTYINIHIYITPLSATLWSNVSFKFFYLSNRGGHDQLVLLHCLFHLPFECCKFVLCSFKILQCHLACIQLLLSHWVQSAFVTSIHQCLSLASVSTLHSEWLALQIGFFLPRAFLKEAEAFPSLPL